MVGGNCVPPPAGSIDGRAYAPLMRIPGPPFSKSAHTSSGIFASSWSALSLATYACGVPMLGLMPPISSWTTQFSSGLKSGAEGET